jgi:hypothetical protein
VPLEAPNLDTRTFDDLLSEARLRIPRYTPDWTDFNESDPGITLVELFSWLTELMLYQMNQIPARNYIKFLQLLGLELQPAQPAVAHLTFKPRAGSQVDPIQPRAQIGAPPPPGGQALIFETKAGLDLIRLPLSDVQVFESAGFQVVTGRNSTPGSGGFWPFGFVPQLSNALYLGFQPDPTVPAPFFPQEMHFRVFLPISTQEGSAQNANDATQSPAAPVDLVWEYKPTATSKYWLPLNVFRDESLAFTREGYILVAGPSNIATSVEGKITDPRYWLRVRLNKGGYDPGLVPQIDFLSPNTVDVENLATVLGEIVGTSEGTPSQTFTLSHRPVQASSLVLSVTVSGTSQNWIQVEDFLGTGKNDPHYVFNANTGVITLGDGRRGLIPPATAELDATYRYGGGSGGNVGADSIKAMLTSLVGIDSVTNTRPAVGGQDEQDVQDLMEQAPHELHSRNRAVTAEDFTAIASQAGGVAKATAIPLAHPDYPGVQVPGAVTVVIVPQNAAQPPQPSSDLIQSVCRYLNGFRLLTTEVYVKGPTYQAITVQAVVAAQPYAAFDAVALAIIKALNDYLDPLGRTTPSSDPNAQPATTTSTSNSTGSSSQQQGRDFGADLYPTSLFGAILAVPGVTAVPSMSITVNGQPHDDLSQAIVVPADGLVYGTGHLISVVPVANK